MKQKNFLLVLNNKLKIFNLLTNLTRKTYFIILVLNITLQNILDFYLYYTLYFGILYIDYHLK